jgi:sulfate adenylyltransferase subunit 1 (EFTu-like GTPase family)
MVARPQSGADRDFRGYMGKISSGSVAPGDRVRVLPGDLASEVARVVAFGGDLDTASAPRSVTLTLKDDLDISRGDMLADPDALPRVTSEVSAILCWMADRPLAKGRKYLLKHTSRTTRCLITDVHHRIDIDTLEADTTDGVFGKNEIGRVSIRTLQPLVCDPYRENRETGAFILIDPGDHNTVACGMIEPE